MRTFKISSYRLDYWQNEWRKIQGDQWGYVHRSIQPGTKVCSCATLKTVGVVVDVEAEHASHYDQNRMVADNVTIMWLTGKKKGKTEVLAVRKVSNFDAYKADVQEHLTELEVTEAEAAATGM